MTRLTLLELTEDETSVLAEVLSYEIEETQRWEPDTAGDVSLLRSIADKLREAGNA